MGDYQELLRFIDSRGFKLRNLRVGTVVNGRTGDEQPDTLAFRIGNGAHGELHREEIARLYEFLGIWLGADPANIEKLEADSALLGRLYAAGVDNWSGYEQAMEGEE